MLGTYASCLLILAASALVGQAVFALSGRRRWSSLSPAIGLAVLVALAWGTVRLPGEGTVAIIAICLAALASLALLRGRIEALDEDLRSVLPVAALALFAASLPFIVEGRFGILGTGLNPDMSQHLLVADRLAAGEGKGLIADGYPLGPHALVVGLSEGTGASLVHVFGGLTLAVTAAAALAALAALNGLSAPRRVLGALLVGLPYMGASFLIQGAFKETIAALFVLAFAIGLAELVRRPSAPEEGVSAETPPAALPLAALAIGAAYSYSFPGLFWLLGAAGLWAIAELWLAMRSSSASAAVERARDVVPSAALALAAAVVAIAPEVPRMVEFAGFETFDPAGAGLGNLFNPISPLEALGIWPSGDFRLDPGDGAAPALAYYLGGALGVGALGFGLLWWLRRRELAVPAALGAAAGFYLYALLAGTPYQESKAIVVAAPLAMLIAARPLLVETALDRPTRRHPSPLVAGLAVAFLGASAGCSVLALVNGPVGPTSYSPSLAETRARLGPGSTLVLAPPELLDEQHGRDYLVWELRGNRVCVERAPVGPSRRRPPPPGFAHVVIVGVDPVDVESYSTNPSASLRGPCPLITESQRAEPGGE